jgi:uncharacterized lipoprotein YmbA
MKLRAHQLQRHGRSHSTAGKVSQFSLLCASLLAGAGCASGPAPRTYVLGTPMEAWSASAPPPEAPRLQLQRILLPDYLDTTDLVLRSGAHELKVSPTGRWGERLSIGLTDALAAALAMRLPQDAVALDPGGERAAWRMLVDVAAFDVWPDGHCVLNASWTVLARDPAAAAVSGRGTFDIAAAGPGPAGDAAIVSAMAKAVGRLADRLAAAVDQAPPPLDAPPPAAATRPTAATPP